MNGLESIVYYILLLLLCLSFLEEHRLPTIPSCHNSDLELCVVLLQHGEVDLMGLKPTP